MKKLWHRLKHLFFSIILLLMVVNLISTGFSSWVFVAETPKTEVNLSVETVTVEEVAAACFENIIISSGQICFDAPKDDQSGSIRYSEADGSSGEQLEIDVSGTVNHYSEIYSIGTTLSMQSETDQLIFDSLIEKKYIRLPSFSVLNQSMGTLSNTALSHWTTDVDTQNDSRSFRIRSQFKWGSFFGNMNPSEFFDSEASNGVKKGSQYTSFEKRHILTELYQLNNMKYTLSLIVNPLSVSFIIDENTYINTYKNLKSTDTIQVPTTVPSLTGYSFEGWTLTADGSNSKTYQAGEFVNIEDIMQFADEKFNITFYAQFSEIIIYVDISFYPGDNSTITEGVYTMKNQVYGSQITMPTAAQAKLTVSNGYEFKYWKATNGSTFNAGDTVTLTDSNFPGASDGTVSLTAHIESSCIIEGTLITMADGTYKNVEDIVAGDEILVFNHETGLIEPSHVVFNDAEPLGDYEIIHCEFENTTVGISYEHAFFDLTLNRYVYINANTIDDYIGHEFVSIEDGIMISQKLVRTYKTVETCRVYSPVTYKTLNIVNDNMLSIGGNITGLFNIFEYDPETLKYDELQKQKDIETYGLLSLEDFGGQIDQYMFDAFNGAYLSVSIGKGMITWERIAELIERYAPLCK